MGKLFSKTEPPAASSASHGHFTYPDPENTSYETDSWAYRYIQPDYTIPVARATRRQDVVIARPTPVRRVVQAAQEDTANNNDCSDRVTRSDGVLQLTVVRQSCTQVSVSCNDRSANVTIEEVNSDTSWRGISMSDLRRGQRYKVTAKLITHSLSLEFRAVLVSDEQRMLLNMAENFAKAPMHAMVKCDQLYRDKPPYYFQTIKQRDGNVMKVYAKDNNGDAAAIINNGAISGLFFATSDPPISVSHFGSRRLLLPADEIVKVNSHLYFGDFYCNKRAHYVTVVLTRPGSKVDVYCEKRLIKLDTNSNCFLRCESSTGDVYVTPHNRSPTHLWIELYCTHDINLSSPFCHFMSVASTGTSRPNGLPKNKNCHYCNL